MLKRLYLSVMMVLMLAVMALPVAASEEAVGVNLPGWVGFLLVFLALLMIVLGSVFMRRNAGS